MKRIIYLMVLYVLTNVSLIAENPFKLDFPEKKDLTNADYIKIQDQLRQINIDPILLPLYQAECENMVFTSFDDFRGRCTKGLRQTLIDPSQDFYPIKHLEKIGRGSRNCIVCCVPFNGKYPNYVKSIIQGLNEQKFNGFFYYIIGGWPNPTGKEIKYAAVPYSFKIFAMVEAHHLGFNNILWIDSACYPLRNIKPLFDVISKQGALLNHFHTPSDAWRFIFPTTRNLLRDLTGTDVLDTQYINTIVFGLKMNTPEAKELIETYYYFADLGLPFLSCFPEEWVLTSIIGQKKYEHWKTPHQFSLILGSLTNEDDSPEEFEKIRKRKVYFYHRKGR